MRHALLAAVLVAAGAAQATTIEAVAEPQLGYIVVLDPSADVANVANAVAASVGETADTVYDRALDGFAVTMTSDDAAVVAADPRVAFVEPDQLVTLEAQSTPTGISRSGATSNPDLDIDGIDDVQVDVDVAVLDTGVDLQHPDLRVVAGVDCLGVGLCRLGGDDDQFHGTHVAGTIGARDNGVGVVGIAPGARIWAVKVFDATGTATLSAILRGLDYVFANAASIDVVNMSFTTPGFSQSMYNAVQSAVGLGVAFSAAAGNDGIILSGFNRISPASFDNVLTVSAIADFDGVRGGLGAPTCLTDQDDTFAAFSNSGQVDIAAPGACITSTMPVERGSYGVLSGSSMATPHVAGALALLSRVDNPANAAQVGALYNRLLAAGSTDWFDDSGDGEQEPLLDVSDPNLFYAVTPACAAISSTGLVAWWRGQNTMTAQTGVTLSGATSYTDARVGRGFQLGADHHLTATTLPTVSTGVTVEMWVRATNTGSTQTLASRWELISTDDNARSFSLTLSPWGDLVWETDETSSRRPMTMRVPASQLFDGNFHHVAATWTTTTAAVYVDGLPLSIQPAQGGELNAATNVEFRLGDQAGPGSPLAFLGVIDEPAVWSRALTFLEINAIRAAGRSGKCV